MLIMKFNFGNNWQNFIDNKLDDERINIAEKSLKEFSIKRNKKAKTFLEELGSPYEIILSDKDGTIAIEWGAYGVPETFLVFERKIIKKIIGPLSQNSLSEIKKIIE